jgi:nucleoside transporter
MHEPSEGHSEATDALAQGKLADASSQAPPLPTGLRIKLSVMMFLQYAIWGAWLPLFFAFVTEYRHLPEDEVGTIFAMAAAGGLLAPFFAGQLADRFLNTEKFLAISHLIGAPLIWMMSRVETYSGFLIFGVAYSIVFAPTLSLTNSLAFHHLPDRDRDFSKVRIWGTVGWIAVGIGIGQYLLHFHTPAGATPEMQHAAHVAGMADSFRLSALLSVALGLFSLFLPKTPPQTGSSKFAAGEALGEIRRQPLLALFIIAFPIGIIHDYYYVLTAKFLGHLETTAGGVALTWKEAINSVFGVGGGGLMTLGQISELAVLGFMPFFTKVLARKTLLTIGLVAYCVRFAVFAYFPTMPAVVPALLLHGLCFGCFYFVAFLVVDENTTSDVRASAQSLFNLLEIGLGTILGHFFSGYMTTVAKDALTKEVNYKLVFGVPMWMAVACLIAHLLFYPSGRATAARR